MEHTFEEMSAEQFLEFLKPIEFKKSPFSGGVGTATIQGKKFFYQESLND